MKYHPDRIQRIKDLCDYVLDIDPAFRPEFLDQQCGSDEELRRDVESLLAHQSGVELFMAKPAWHHVVRDMAMMKTKSLAGYDLGRYQLHEQLGRGGMGHVWRATDRQLKRDVAIKIVPPELSGYGERVRRFEQEAYAVSALNHANIITIHEIGESGDLHFIVTELVEGQTLRERLASGPLGWREAVRVAAQIASGLSAAHAVGIIHRDIKPENVIVQPDGHVKVLDFGIAKWFKDAAHGRSELAGKAVDTMAGATPGTLKYMSPEQIRGEPLDPTTDVFSLGLVLYEMIAGHHPYTEMAADEFLRALKHEDEIPVLDPQLQDMPAALYRILVRALRKQRGDRYPSAIELSADLEELKSLVEVSRQEMGEKIFRVQSANQLLTQFAILYDADKKTRVPLSVLWTIWRFADLKRGKLESETFRKSLFAGAMKVGLLAIAVAAVTTAAAALKSVNVAWTEVILRDGHTAAVRRAVFSPNGRLLISVGEDKQIIVWDFLRRERLSTLKEHTGAVNTVAFSPDGKWFATGSDDKSVIVWDAVRLLKAAVLHEHEAPVNALAFSPDGRFLFSSSKVTVMTEVGSWKKIREFEWANSYGNLLFIPDKGLMMDNSGRQWDLNTGQMIKDTNLSWVGNWAALSPDHKRWASVDTSGDVKLVDLEQQKLVSVRHAHFDHGRSVEFSPDGKWLATGAERVVLWDLANDAKVAPLEYESIVWSVAFSPDGRWLVTTHGDGAILVWDVLQRERVANLREHSGGVRAVAFSPDGQRVASASEDQSVIVWDTSQNQKQTVLLGHHSRVSAVAFSKDNRWLASADQDGVVIRWNLEQRMPQLTINPGKGANSYCVAISPDGKWIATTHGVYDSSNGSRVLDLVGDHGAVYGIAFTGKGEKLICVTDHNSIRVFDTRGWRIIDEQRWADRPLIAISVSNDGKYLVTGDDDAVVRLGTIDPLRQVAVLGNHAARIKSVAFSPDGATVASAGDDKTISLWDVSTRSLITHIGTHTSPVYSIAFSPDGARLVSGEHDRSVRLYTRHRTLWGFRLG